MSFHTNFIAVCAFPYLLAFTTNTIEIRLVVNANLVHTLVLPKVCLISAKVRWKKYYWPMCLGTLVMPRFGVVETNNIIFHKLVVFSRSWAFIENTVANTIDAIYLRQNGKVKCNTVEYNGFPVFWLAVLLPAWYKYICSHVFCFLWSQTYFVRDLFLPPTKQWWCALVVTDMHS